MNEMIQQLLETKDFEELELAERELVLIEMTEEEYTLQRNVLVSAADLMEEEAVFLSPDPIIKSRLRDALSKKEIKEKNSFSLAAIFSFRLPAYQVAFGTIALLVGFIWFGGDSEVTVVTQDRIVEKTRIDTVFVTEEVVVENIQVVEKKVKVYVEKPASTNHALATQTLYSEMQEKNATTNSYAFTDEELEEQQQKSMGNTSLSKDELDQFLVVVN